MKKIISYVTIFIIFYLQLSIINPIEVKAEENLNIPISQLIMPESSWFWSGNTVTNISENLVSTWISNEIQVNIISKNNNNYINNTDDKETYFIVTAYYSPLPNQQHYLRWNYQDEIILNGKGIRWASWKNVFPGMFAGPKNYDFWTKIYLEWIWVWEISDRWWAIVSTATWETRWYEYDRIDMWMWFWEEWLKKALAWWKRKIKWKLLFDNNSQVSLDLTQFPAPDYVVKNLNYKPFMEKNIIPKYAIFEKYIWPESNESNIKELQKIFLEMWLYNWIIDGKYDTIKDVLVNYQIKLWVIDVKTDDGAWYFWPKTRVKVKENYITYLNTKSIQEQEVNKRIIILAQIKETVKIKVEKHIISIWNPKPGDIWENIKSLQKTLKTLGYLKIQESNIFWEKTKIWLIKYQIEKWIVKNKTDDWAWYFWPKTKEIIKTELVALLEKQVLKERNLLSYNK